MVMPKASTFQKLMTTYVWCMMSSDLLNMLLLHISNHTHDKEHMNIINGMDGPLVSVQTIKE
jgi:hypothetical protein